MFWEAHIHSLTTLSIHLYERDSHKPPFSTRPSTHLLRDHTSRALLLRFYTDIYAILPLRQPEDDIPDDLSPDELKPYYPSFIVTAAQLEETIAHIHDETFLHEYREPTLAILFSGQRTATGLLDHRRDTTTLIATTLDLQLRASTTIFEVTGLPYDCNRVISLPAPVGGLLVLGTNVVVHVDQAGRCLGVGVNAYARKTTSFPLSHRPYLALKLEGAVPVSLHNPDGDVLLALRDGTFIRIKFLRDGRNVTDLDFEVVEYSATQGIGLAGFSCGISLDSERVFLGSGTGDSVLIGHTARRTREREGVKVGMNDTLEDLDDLYGDEEEDAGTKVEMGGSKLRLTIHDFLLSTAPIRDIAYGIPAYTEVPPQRRTPQPPNSPNP